MLYILQVSGAKGGLWEYRVRSGGLVAACVVENASCIVDFRFGDELAILVHPLTPRLGGRSLAVGELGHTR